MAAFVADAHLTLLVNMQIPEAELVALERLAQYAPEEIVRVLGTYISESAMREHGPALITFLNSVRHEAGPILRKTAKARDIFEES